MAVSLLAVSVPAFAADGAPLSPTQAAAARRAEEEGDKVYKWILVNAASSRAPAPVAPAPAVKPRPAPRALTAGRGAKEVPATMAKAPRSEEPVAVAIAERSVPVPAPVPSPVPVTGGAAADAPDQPLEALERVEPDFPASIVKRLQAGSVRIGFEVQTDGSVTAPQVIESDSARLNAAAIAAIGKWRFKPLAHAQHGEVRLVFNSDGAGAAR